MFVRHRLVQTNSVAKEGCFVSHGSRLRIRVDRERSVRGANVRADAKYASFDGRDESGYYGGVYRSATPEDCGVERVVGYSNRGGGSPPYAATAAAAQEGDARNAKHPSLDHEHEVEIYSSGGRKSKSSRRSKRRAKERTLKSNNT